MTATKQRTCRHCSKVFQVSRPSQLGHFCSIKCRAEASRTKPKNTPRPCAQCGTMFTPNRSNRNARFCSRQCNGRAKARAASSYDTPGLSNQSILNVKSDPSMKPLKLLPPLEYLQLCFSYDRDTGLLTWKHRPRDHFPTPRAWATWNARFAGKITGPGVSILGYHLVAINHRMFFAHRVIWKLITGEDPIGEVDHKDRNPSNNRWANLRMATPQKQKWNEGLRENNTSGFRGVSRENKRYRARISVRGVEYRLGLFDTPEAASATYEAKARELHGEFYSKPNHADISKGKS